MEICMSFEIFLNTQSRRDTVFLFNLLHLTTDASTTVIKNPSNSKSEAKGVLLDHIYNINKNRTFISVYDSCSYKLKILRNV